MDYYTNMLIARIAITVVLSLCALYWVWFFLWIATGNPFIIPSSWFRCSCISRRPKPAPATTEPAPAATSEPKPPFFSLRRWRKRTPDVEMGVVANEPQSVTLATLPTAHLAAAKKVDEDWDSNSERSTSPTPTVVEPLDILVSQGYPALLTALDSGTTQTTQPDFSAPAHCHVPLPDVTPPAHFQAYAL